MSRESDHPVLQVIRRRFEDGTSAGKHADDFKVGLAIEGGGMRGVVTTAMAAALHYLGLVQCFDAVYGSSAGAFTGTHFVTDKMPIGPTIFYEDLTCTDFINPWRALLPRAPIMNLDYLLVDILKKKRPLNWEGVISSSVPLKIVVSSVDERKSKLFSDFASPDEVFTILKASATVPFIAGPPVEFHGERLFDASLYEPIPVHSAESDGCTHVLALLSRPRLHFKKPSRVTDQIVRRRLDAVASGLGEDYMRQAEGYNELLRNLYEESTRPRPEHPRLAITLREGTPELPRLTRNRDAVMSAAIDGMKAVFARFLGEPVVNVHSVLYPVSDGGVPVADLFEQALRREL